ncbi:hypothetical protein AS25_05475 [Kocuria marina]|uniref:NlpC/P60 domain-containing protein n=1 Tax=Kocuria marina TaxID=223184 RepID=A0A0B0DHG9_9MICC|nr:C40 family peptidase [Kocuria marina]KHE74719.1 hypothetical protein AS25_05475 [Kocuria marina]
MPMFQRRTARHRAQTPSRLVRRTTLAAAAGATVLGSVAPAQAYAELPTPSNTASSTPAPVVATLASSPAAAPIVPAATPAPGAQAASTPQMASASDVSVQSTDTTAVSTSGNGLVGTAMQGVGGGYVWGGTAFGAWDCSGFTQWVYAQNGIEIPRTSQAQWAAGTPTANPQPGDLVVQNGGGHIGVYLGGGKMISALNPTQGTFVHDVNAMPVVGYVTFR